MFVHFVRTKGLNLSLYTQSERESRLAKQRLSTRLLLVIAYKQLACSHTRSLPAHLAFILVAKEYLNIAESENRFVVLEPGGKDVGLLREAFFIALWFLPSLHSMRNISLSLAGTCFYCFCKGVHFDRISHCWEPCYSRLSWLNAGLYSAVLKELRPPRFLGMQGMTLQTRHDKCTTPPPLPEQNNHIRRQVGNWFGALLIVHG